MNYWMLLSCIDDAVALIKSRETLMKLDKQKLQSYKDDLKCHNFFTLIIHSTSSDINSDFMNSFK